jgi:hypothetical protein
VQPEVRAYAVVDGSLLEVAEVTIGAVLSLRALLLFRINDKISITLDRSGIVTYNWNYYSINNSWPEEHHSLEAIERGYCDTFFQINSAGVYEVKITWPGDDKTLPSTSNIVIITVK